MSERDRDLEHRRRLLIAAAMALGITLIGFVSGTNPGQYVPKTAPAPPAAAAPRGDVAPARSHAELAERPWGAGPARSGWAEVKASGQTTSAGRPDVATLEVGRSSGPNTELAAARREERRAYAGAPPVIPHPIRQNGAAECLACHADGFSIAEARAGLLPHADYASCTQCHVVSVAPFRQLPANPAASARNDFEGLRIPAGGERAYPGAPPLIPHSTQMRERCDACHGVTAKLGLHTRHPERRSCTQCHGLSAQLEQAPTASATPVSQRRGSLGG